ncbi:hypothetical protein AAMO2058_001641400 [Amorphochlora amoebiformis]
MSTSAINNDDTTGNSVDSLYFPSRTPPNASKANRANERMLRDVKSTVISISSTPRGSVGERKGRTRQARTMTSPLTGTFKQHRIEELYEVWTYEKRSINILTRCVVLAALYLAGFLAVGLPAGDSAIYIMRIALFGASCVIMLIVSLSRWNPRSFQTFGSLSVTICGVFVGISAGAAETDGTVSAANSFSLIVLFLVAVQITGLPLIFKSLLFVSWVTVAAAIGAMIGFDPDLNPYATVRRCIALLMCNLILNNHVFTKEESDRSLFLNMRESKTKTEMLEKENKTIKAETRTLMREAYEQMLAKNDLAPDFNKSDQNAVMGSPVETIQNLLENLQLTNKSNNDASKILAEVRRVLTDCKGDIFHLSFESFKTKTAELDSEMMDWLEDVVGRSAQMTRSRRWARGEPLTVRSITVSGHHNHDFRKLAKSMSEIHSPYGVGLESKENITFMRLYDAIDDYDFDVFEVIELTEWRPLLFVGNALFGKYGLVSRFDIDMKKLNAFCAAIERGYDKKIKYHNSAHGADVARSCHYFLHRSKLASKCSPIEILSLIIAGLIHDYKHFGFTNSYLVNSEHKYAVEYNDISIMENVSISHAFRLISQSEYNILENLSLPDQKEVRERVIQLVLATDLAKHKEYLEKFKITVKNSSEDVGMKPEIRETLFNMIIKCSDLGHAAKRQYEHFKWTKLIQEELFSQGDLERKNGLPVNPLMDRQKNTQLAQSQAKFFELLVIPMFQPLCEYLEMEVPVWRQVKANLQFWRDNSEIRQFSDLENLAATTPKPPPKTRRSNSMRRSAPKLVDIQGVDRMKPRNERCRSMEPLEGLAIKNPVSAMPPIVTLANNDKLLLPPGSRSPRSPSSLLTCGTEDS